MIDHDACCCRAHRGPAAVCPNCPQHGEPNRCWITVAYSVAAEPVACNEASRHPSGLCDLHHAELVEPTR